MTLRKALLAATVLALPVAAQAQPVSGLYIGAGAGMNFLQNIEDNSTKTITKQPGFVGLGSLGYGFGNGLRAEIEGNYRQNDIDKIKTGGRTTSGSAGYIEQYGVMGNLLYDIDLGLPFTPYLGVGAGYSW